MGLLVMKNLKFKCLVLLPKVLDFFLLVNLQNGLVEIVEEEGFLKFATFLMLTADQLMVRELHRYASQQQKPRFAPLYLQQQESHQSGLDESQSEYWLDLNWQLSEAFSKYAEVHLKQDLKRLYFRRDYH